MCPAGVCKLQPLGVGHRAPRVPTQPRFCSPGLCFAVQTCLSWQAAPWLRWEPGRANRRHERRGWREIPPFREQTAAEIDFFPLFTRVSSPRCRAERPRITITCSEVRARFAECVYYYQGLKTIPNHPVFSSFLFFFSPSFSFFLPFLFLEARGPGSALLSADQFRPNGSSPAPSFISRLLKEHLKLHGRLGEKKKAKKKKPIWRRDHIFSVSSPFVLYLPRTKAGSGSRWGRGSRGR